jgi:hypothetical protein
LVEEEQIEGACSRVVVKPRSHRHGAGWGASVGLRSTKSDPKSDLCLLFGKVGKGSVSHPAKKEADVERLVERLGNVKFACITIAIRPFGKSLGVCSHPST